VSGYFWYVQTYNLTLLNSLDRLSDFLTGGLYGPLIFILIYALRPLLFFPTTLLTLLSGFLFGSIGILYTMLGSNASAMLAYFVGRFFGQGVMEDEKNAGLIQQYTRSLRQNSFETVLIMRLVLLPYDLVNYAAGFLKIGWPAFLAATAIGSLPGTTSLVLFGTSFGSLEALFAGDVQLNPATLLISFVLVVASIGLSRLIKRREAQK
jgi:uncharacterized membrane protein YdjX (TVP38/TMEM64 family)